MNWYLKVLKQYVDFSGRARRKEFWMFVLINGLITVGLRFLDRSLGTTFGDFNEDGILETIYSITVLIPTLSVSVRRLHDIGKSGWYLLLMFLPIIGWIWLIVLYVSEGEYKINKWGENPKGFGNDTAIHQIGKE